jgi:hypothetical protein
MPAKFVFTAPITVFKVVRPFPPRTPSLSGVLIKIRVFYFDVELQQMDKALFRKLKLWFVEQPV